ncbi:YqjK-like family protein [Zoogloea sp.]|uniref:YqjK-like family protein n=1 Tax=Zoogloea sp. TaxID=49181 RepID=UPI00262C78E7|nr:YqjK-like family protein [Zoogloea sp.]MDD3353388.1 YqjK-like family protein [Zoogloea sp.]
MNPELIELALRKQRLQARCTEQRAALTRHASTFTPLLNGVDRIADGVRWARDHAPIVTGVGIFLVVTRPRASLRWARRAWFGWKMVQRARALIP